MTQLTTEEIDHLQSANIAALVHCPESNLKLGSGICPVSSIGNVNLCVGTDGASSNDDLDILGEVRTANILDNFRSKIELGNLNKSVKSIDWIRTVTINAAKALRIDDKVGSVEIGKFADLVAIKINALPVYDIRYSLIMSGINPVTDLWVAGRPILRNDVVLGFDEKAVNKKAIEWGKKILETCDHHS